MKSSLAVSPGRRPGAITRDRAAAASGREMDPSAGERELLGRLGRLDEDAFRELVERYAHLVRAWAQGILGDPHEAEDAAQETFLRAFRRLAAFRGEGSIEAWLFRICRNNCLDRLRARPDVELVELGEEVAVGPDPTAGEAVLGSRGSGC